MDTTRSKGVELSGDIQFIKTPAATPSEYNTGESCRVSLANVSSPLWLACCLSAQKLADFFQGQSYP
jgi:hypothetical protein